MKLFQIHLFTRFYCSISNTSKVINEIQIPNKIYRDELSVLKALSNCVKLERGTPAFSVIDQPLTFPMDYFWRKKSVWSKSSGKLSARMAFNEIKNEFINVALDEPKVKSLMPLISTEEIIREVQEKRMTPDKGLDKVIRLLSPIDAWSLYETFKSANFSAEVIQSLLELLCATAGVNLNEGSESSFSEPKIINWSITNNAELLFADIETKNPKLYCAIIRGASKFNDPSRALELLNIMRSQFPDAVLDLETTNSLLRSIVHSKMSDADVRMLIIDILDHLNKNKIAPNTHTFNNALVAFSNRHPAEFIQQLYLEMIECGLEPTLGTYAILLKCNFTRTTLYALAHDILEILEVRAVDYEETTSIDDRTLFLTMMESFRSMVRLDLARRLADIVDCGGRFHMFVNEADRSSYFNTYLKMLTDSKEDLGVVLDILARYIPNYYAMSPRIVDVFVEKIRRTGNLLLMPKLIHIVNWRAKTNYESKTFLKILRIFAEADYIGASDLRKSVCDCLTRVLAESSVRQKSVLTFYDNLVATLRLAMKLNLDTLTWDLLVFADDLRVVRASMVAPLMTAAFQGGQYDRVVFLWQCLARSVHSRPMTVPSERDSLHSLIEAADRDIVPLLAQLNAGVTETRACIDECRHWLARGLTDADFAAEEASKAAEWEARAAVLSGNANQSRVDQ